MLKVSITFLFQFSVSFIGTPKGIEAARSICERAVVAAGVHVAKGGLIWSLYRELEIVLLSMQPGSEEQKERVDKIFRRQLAVPLTNMQATMTEYKEWLEANERPALDKNVERTYNSCLNKLKPRQEIEDRLEAAGSDDEKSLEAYKEYLDLELKEANPVRVQSIFERRSADHCLLPQVWTEYVDYLEAKLKMADVSIPVFERAVRNCTWSSTLWIKFLRALERHKQPKAKVVTTMEQALAVGLAPTDTRDLWLAYIDYERRQMNLDEDNEEDPEAFKKEREELRGVFNRAIENLGAIEGADPDSKVARYWAAIEADRFHATDQARNIWSQIVMGGTGDKAQYWLEYLTLEKQFGDTKHLRRLFPRAIDRTQDLPELIGEVWLQFEREEGSLEQYEAAEAKVNARLKVVAEQRANQEAETQARIEKRKERDKDKRREKRHQDAAAKKRKFLPSSGESEKGHAVNDQPPFKKPALKEKSGDFKTPASIPPPPGFKKSNSDTKRSAASVPPPPGFKAPAESSVAPPPGFKGGVKPPPGFKEEGGDGSVSAGRKESRTVFVSNLDFSTDEKAIEEVMQASGEVSGVRLVKNYSGKSKGFAFVEFKTAEAAKHALGRDHELIKGRPMYVQEHDPEKKAKGHQFKYSTGMEKSKLFVKGLPKSMDKDQVTALFSPFGEIKELRLVTFRNGHSKGIAYVDFKDEVAAARALVKLDETEIEGFKISVAISNPPARKDQPQQQSVASRSLGGGSRDAGATGGGGPRRPQMAFIPRSVQKTPAASASSTSNGNGNANGNGNGAHATPKSNDDFRNMLLGKK